MNNYCLYCGLLLLIILSAEGKTSFLEAFDPCPPPLKTCAGHGTCLNSLCTCDAGWGGALCNETTGNPSCPTDISSKCPAGSSRCLDISDNPDIPFYQCKCYDGYLQKNNGETCDDINECSGSVCSPNANCTNIPGTYFCTCQDGWQGDGKTCTDIDECKTSNPCANRNNTRCDNVSPPEKYRCSCLTGYLVDPQNPLVCILPSAPVTPITPVQPTTPSTGYKVIFKVNPSVLCWTRNAKGWNAYFTYKNKYFEDRYIGNNLENAISFNGAAPKTDYAGLLDSYPVGEHYAFVIENEKSGNVTSITWLLDGNRVTIDSNDPDFGTHRCPKEIVLSLTGDVSCTITKSKLQQDIYDKVTALLNNQATQKGYTPVHNVSVEVTTACTKKRAIQAAATVTLKVSDPAPPSDTAQYSAMDIVFPTLIGNSTLTSEIGKAGLSIPPKSSPSTEGDINPMVGAQDPEQVVSEPGPDIPALSMSYLTFAIILASIIIGLIIICIIAVLIYKGRQEDTEERV